MSYTWLFFGFSGRFSPSRYWLGLTMCLALQVGDNVQLGLLAGALPQRGFAGLVAPAIAISWGLFAYTLYLLATVHIRRLHDMDLSGLYALLALISIVGLAPLVVICGFRRGTAGANRFGPDPSFDAGETVAAFTDPS